MLSVQRLLVFGAYRGATWSARLPRRQRLGVVPSHRSDDIISVQEQFTGLEEKESQFAGHILIQSGVSHYFNQRGEEIAKTRGWQIRA